MAWDNAIVPKHAFIAFILWLAIKDGLLLVIYWLFGVGKMMCFMVSAEGKNGMQESLVF